MSKVVVNNSLVNCVSTYNSIYKSITVVDNDLSKIINDFDTSTRATVALKGKLKTQTNNNIDETAKKIASGMDSVVAVYGVKEEKNTNLFKELLITTLRGIIGMGVIGKTINTVIDAGKNTDPSQWAKWFTKLGKDVTNYADKFQKYMKTGSMVGNDKAFAN